MKRAELEKYLGKKVTVKLFDNAILSGELHKTGEERFKYDANLYLPKNFYFLLPHNPSIIFRCTHVKKLTEGGRQH